MGRRRYSMQEDSKEEKQTWKLEEAQWMPENNQQDGVDAVQNVR